MIKHGQDTIAAIATPIGEGGISVIRVSGLDAVDVTSRRFSGRLDLQNAGTHSAHLGKILDEHEAPVDEVVCTVFREPHSYTGENTVEISCHGGILVTRRVLEVLLQSGARHAEPGEFTKRAFLNGRIDLSQAEAVADLIHARSDLAHRSSLQQLEGALSSRIRELRDQLIDTIGVLELELDFAEEGVELIEKETVARQIEGTILRIDGLISTYRFGRIYREGVKVVLAGGPNVGKSSLLNALLNQNRAIVNETPGTTRDVIEEAINIGGMMFRMIDTAGLRSAVDPVEREGVRRTETQVENSDLVLFMIDCSRGMSAEDVGMAESIVEKMKAQSTSCIVVINKIDLRPRPNGEMLKNARFLLEYPTVNISALNGTGLDNLKSALLEVVFQKKVSSNEASVTVTNSRHASALLGSRKSLSLALNSVKERRSGEFIALDLRAALDFLGEIIGVVTTEEILNSVFSRFCIGK